MASREDLASELNQIKVALGRVAAFRGIDGVSPTALLVDELVRDHEELEARIDAVIMHIRQIKDGIIWAADQEGWLGQIDEMARLLQGGARVPETPEDLEGNG